MTTYLYHLTLPNAVFHNPAASVLLPVALGTAVGYSTRPMDTKRVYESIRQPPLRPPAWVFGPVWTVLYCLMGYAAHRAVSVGSGPLQPVAVAVAARRGAALYTVQLGLNLVWMPLFFGLGRPIEATVDVAALLGINSYLAWLWGSRVDLVAGLCLAPYVAWLGFATYLCGATSWDLKKYSNEKTA